MIAKILSRSGSIGRDERGTSMIELALVAPVLAIMLMGVIDIAMGYSRRLTIEQAAYRALEKVTVGTVQSDYSFVETEARAALTAARITPTSVVVDKWLECGRARAASWDDICPAGQMISRYVKVTIVANYRPKFNYGPLGTAFGRRTSDGNIALTAATSVRIQ